MFKHLERNYKKMEHKKFNSKEITEILCSLNATERGRLHELLLSLQQSHELAPLQKQKDEKEV